jgi:hypothetical protein
MRREARPGGVNIANASQEIPPPLPLPTAGEGKAVAALGALFPSP